MLSLTVPPPSAGCIGIVSVTDFPPFPGGRRSHVGPSEGVCAEIGFWLRETGSLTKASLSAVCSASCSCNRME